MAQIFKVNKEKMQEEYKKEVKRENPNKSAFPILFLKEGETKLRVLPPWSAEGVWYRKTHEHPAYVNGFFNPVACPKKMANQPCPFCEESDRLYKLGGEENIEAAKKFRWSTKFFMNIVVHDSPDKERGNLNVGVQVLKVGKKILDQILNYDQDASEGWGDITDLENGYDLKITRRGNEQYNTEYTVMAAKNPTNIVEDLKKAGIKNIELVDLDDVVTVLTYNELKAIMLNNHEEVGKEETPVTGTGDFNPEVPNLTTSTVAPPPPPRK